MMSHECEFLIASDLVQHTSVEMSACITRDTTHNFNIDKPLQETFRVCCQQ